MSTRYLAQEFPQAKVCAACTACCCLIQGPAATDTRPSAKQQHRDAAEGRRNWRALIHERPLPLPTTNPNHEQCTGLDLSPYMLAVAELRERQSGGGGGQRQVRLGAGEPSPMARQGLRQSCCSAVWQLSLDLRPPLCHSRCFAISRVPLRCLYLPPQRITYVHRDMEHNGMPDGSFDLVAINFVTHELPGEVIARLVRNACVCEVGPNCEGQSRDTQHPRSPPLFPVGRSMSASGCCAPAARCYLQTTTRDPRSSRTCRHCSSHWWVGASVGTGHAQLLVAGCLCCQCTGRPVYMLC